MCKRVGSIKILFLAVTVILLSTVFTTGLALAEDSAGASGQGQVDWNRNTQNGKVDINGNENISGDWGDSTFVPAGDQTASEEDTSGNAAASTAALAILAGMAGALGISALTGKALSKKEVTSIIPEGNGIWVAEEDREKVEELVNKAASKTYYIDSEGFLKEKEDSPIDTSKSETYSSMLDDLINGDKKVVIGVNGTWNSYNAEDDKITVNGFSEKDGGVAIGDNGTDQVIIISGEDTQKTDVDGQQVYGGAEITLAHEIAHAVRGVYGLKNEDKYGDGVNHDEEAYAIQAENKVRDELDYGLRGDGDENDDVNMDEAADGDGSYGRYNTDDGSNGWYGNIDESMLTEERELSGSIYQNEWVDCHTWHDCGYNETVTTTYDCYQLEYQYVRHDCGHDGWHDCRTADCGYYTTESYWQDCGYYDYESVISDCGYYSTESVWHDCSYTWNGFDWDDCGYYTYESVWHDCSYWEYEYVYHDCGGYQYESVWHDCSHTEQVYGWIDCPNWYYEWVQVDCPTTVTSTQWRDCGYYTDCRTWVARTLGDIGISITGGNTVGSTLQFSASCPNAHHMWMYVYDPSGHLAANFGNGEGTSISTSIPNAVRGTYTVQVDVRNVPEGGEFKSSSSSIIIFDPVIDYEQQIHDLIYSGHCSDAALQPLIDARNAKIAANPTIYAGVESTAAMVARYKAAAAASTTSIDDYFYLTGQLSKIGLDARRALAQQLGFINYSGTSEENAAMLNYYRSGTPIPAKFTSLPGSVTIKDVDTNGVVLNITNPAGKTLRIWENGVQLSVPALTASDTTYAIELNSGKHYKFELLLSDGTVVSTVEADTPSYLTLGSSGTAVTSLQQKLLSLGYSITVNGSFDSQTDAAVRKFQTLRGLSADGIVGPNTTSAIKTVINNKNAGYLSRGMIGSDVLQLQKDLNKLGYNCGTPDGEFGGNTYNALVAFQAAKGLSQDGVVGPDTRSVLNAALGGTSYTQILRSYYNTAVSGYTNFETWIAATHELIDTNNPTPFKYYYENVWGKDPNYRTYKEWLTLFGFTLGTPPVIPDPVEPNPANADNTTLNKILNVVQTILDVAGFFPGIGDIADGINTGICLLRGDLLGAVFSGIALIPGIGSAIAMPLKTIFRAAGNVTEVKAAINVLASIFGGIDNVIDGLKTALNTVTGLIRGIPDLVESLTNNAFVRNLIGNDGVQAIGTMVVGLRNKVDDLIGKTDEVIQTASGAAVYVGKTADEIADYYAGKVANKTRVSGNFIGSPSEILRAELKNAGVTSPPFSNQAHHIIPEGMDVPELNEARALMDTYGVDLNSASNGVFLPDAPNLTYAGSATVHSGSHTAEYARYVANAIKNINPTSSSDIVSVLNDLREQLLNGTLRLNSL